MSEISVVTVNVGNRSYPVLVGDGARHELAAHINPAVRRVAVVTQENIPAALIPSFGERAVTLHTIGAGEDHKSMSTVETLCRSFARDGLTRSDLVVGVGGGMVTDVAGFAAASYHRGTSVMHVATSLLAMVDAAVGGKTGVNIPEGKNLIGAFWQPFAVACDTEALATLSPRESRCGMGEMAKYHFIAREDLSSLPLHERVARSVEIKARIVESDERESGDRALLNYGHTLAHALETLTGYSVAHGEAVSLGLLYAAHLARRMGRISDARVEDHYAVVRGTYDLKVPLPKGLDFADVLLEMGRDKKALSSLTFVLDSADGLQVVPGIKQEDAYAAWDEFVLRNA
mgnify:CR=1 FL=1